MPDINDKGASIKTYLLMQGFTFKDKKRRWCPTETNENSEHVANSEKWGYCSGYCPIELGKGKH